MNISCSVKTCILLQCLISAQVSRSEVLEIRHHQGQERYEFGLKLLDLAISKLGIEYKIIDKGGPDTNEARGELLVLEGKLDLEFLSTSLQRESLMIPIKIPVYRGLLGLRLLLIKPDKIELFKQVDNLEKLRKFLALHGTHWKDLPVYKANQLPVITSVNYESLFKMLIHNRADYFHRGISEIYGELGRYREHLVIAEDIALFYPHPVYFFVTKRRPDLAVLLEKGLLAAEADGSFQALFNEEYASVIESSKLASRKIIVLKNPAVPPNSPAIDTSWWMPEKTL